MSESMRESLSALMDDEANELEIERVLTHIAANAELRETWMRYNMVRSVTNGRMPGCPALDVSAGVREAISDEAPSTAGLRQRLLKPLASVAVAASVAGAVVLGGQQLAQLEADSYDNRSVASSVSPVGMINSLGATSVRASYGTRSVAELHPASHTAYQELARQRLQKYMQEHAEHAALNSPSGLVPFARVTHIKE